jgi:hypothetical protein
MHSFFKVDGCSAGEENYFFYAADLELFQPKPCSYLSQFKPMQIFHPNLQEAFNIIFSFSYPPRSVFPLCYPTKILNFFRTPICVLHVSSISSSLTILYKRLTHEAYLKLLNIPALLFSVLCSSFNDTDLKERRVVNE